MTDRDEKMQKLVPHSIKQDIRAVAGIPSWITLFMKKVIEHTGKPISQVWPNLELCAHGGISLQSYETELKQLLPQGTKFIDIYSASE